jgi:putative transposase
VLDELPLPAQTGTGTIAGVDLNNARRAPTRRMMASRPEQNDEWTESRRYMGLEILAACRKAAQTDMGQENTSETELTVEAIPA